MDRPWSYDKNFLSHVDQFRKYERFSSSVVFGAQVLSESGRDLNVADAQLNLLNLPSDHFWLSFEPAFESTRWDSWEKQF